MKEKSLLKVALVCSLIGVTVLFFISEFIEVEERNIEEITIDDLDKNVKIIGTVSKIVDTDKVVIMDITQPQKLKVMLFKDKEINLKKGNYIEVLGKVQEYEGELEIIGDRIRRIN